MLKPKDRREGSRFQMKPAGEGEEWNTNFQYWNEHSPEIADPKELSRLVNNYQSGMAEHHQEIRWCLETIRSLQEKVESLTRQRNTWQAVAQKRGWPGYQKDPTEVNISLQGENERLREIAFGRFVGLAELIESGIPENGCAAVSTIMFDIPETQNGALASAKRNGCSYLLLLVSTDFRLEKAK